MPFEIVAGAPGRSDAPYSRFTSFELVTTEQQFRDKLRKITALFEGAATAGERQAAAAAIERIRQALHAAAKTQPVPERSFPWRINGKGAYSLRFAGDTGSNRIAAKASVTPR